MQILVLVIIIQLVVIIWLAYPRIMPKAIDIYERARQVSAKVERTAHEQWVHDFNVAQGIRSPEKAPQALGASHSLKDVKRVVEYEVELLKWKCTCGHDSESFSAGGMRMDFADHVKLVKEADKYQ